MQGLSGRAYCPAQVLALEKLPVELSHHSGSCRDRHRIAHGHNRLHPGLQQPAAKAGLGICGQLGRLAGIEHSYGYAMHLQKIGNFLGLNRIGLAGLR